MKESWSNTTATTFPQDALRHIFTNMSSLDVSFFFSKEQYILNFYWKCSTLYIYDKLLYRIPVFFHRPCMPKYQHWASLLYCGSALSSYSTQKGITQLYHHHFNISGEFDTCRHYWYHRMLSMEKKKWEFKSTTAVRY